MRNLAALLPALFLLGSSLLPAGTTLAQPLHGISMHGTPELPADFRHFPYVNPDVKKGGRMSYGVVGTFDSLNPFVLKGMRTTARGVWDPEFGNLLRIADAALKRRAFQPLWPLGRNRGMGRRAQLHPVQHQPQGKMV